MTKDLSLRIILQSPPPGVDFGLQKGSGNKYETVQTQRSVTVDLLFTFSIQIKGDRQKDSQPGFVGAFVQGPVTEKFVYIDIGKLAGQHDSCWDRRLKVPLRNITWDMVEQAQGTNNPGLETYVAGTGRDGGPNCATVKPFDGWKLSSNKKSM